tara:strand:+ start:22 stop:405 length:384 start_codon:yes stop_codon:yes gene_type:complete
MKNIQLAIIGTTFFINLAFAGCGACNVSNKKVDPPKGEFVTSINEDGSVKGMVLASCGMCNFGMDMKDCGLAIQINEESFTVKGTTIEDHGDSHAKEGFCNAIRVAKISGTVKDKVFLAENFKLQKN